MCSKSLGSLQFATHLNQLFGKRSQSSVASHVLVPEAVWSKWSDRLKQFKLSMARTPCKNCWVDVKVSSWKSDVMPASAQNSRN